MKRSTILTKWEEYVKFKSPNNYSKNKEWIIGFVEYVFEEVK